MMQVKVRDLREGDAVLYGDGSVAYTLLTDAIVLRSGRLAADVRWHDGGTSGRAWDSADADMLVAIDRRCDR